MNLTFGEKIKEARKLKGFTQKQLAAKIGAKHNSVSDWENNKNKPDPDTIELLCGVLNITPNYLLATETGEFSPAEKLLIKKYRDLDDHGKKCVNSVLEWETQRTQMLADMQKQLINKDSRIKELEITTLPTRIISYYQKLASAGSGEYLFDEIPCDNIIVPENSLSEKADFVIGVNGHSMEPTYHDGDKVYIEISEEIPTGSIGIFIRGSECFIKELGTDRLISHNPDKGTYPDIPATTDIRCVGLVLGKVEEL